MSSSLELLESFGPKITRGKLSEDTTEALYNMCLQKNLNPDNRKLVGYIKEENDITLSLKQDSKVHKILLDLVEEYIEEIDPGIFRNVITEKKYKANTLIELTSGWYNKQIAMEYNPIHHHNNAADLVCVLYPKISLDNDVKNYVVNTSDTPQQKGQIHFVYGQTPNNNGFGNWHLNFEPKQGDIFIFPGSVLHYTAPVLGNSVRYSISCNFNIHSHIQYLARKNQVPGLKQ
tara:strand:- start:3515 stop:4210 length:696 start_codon:yes stop_codon:yes gene_type:complete